MKIYKNISIFKKDNATGAQPTHDLVATDEKFENKVTVASLWTKDSQKGKFLSGQMKKEWKGEKGTFPAYVIVQEDELNELIAIAKKHTPVSSKELEGLDKVNQEMAEKYFETGMTPDELSNFEGMEF